MKAAAILGVLVVTSGPALGVPVVDGVIIGFSSGDVIEGEEHFESTIRFAYTVAGPNGATINGSEAGFDRPVRHLGAGTYSMTALPDGVVRIRIESGSGSFALVNGSLQHGVPISGPPKHRKIDGRLGPSDCEIFVVSTTGITSDIFVRLEGRASVRIRDEHFNIVESGNTPLSAVISSDVPQRLIQLCASDEPGAFSLEVTIGSLASAPPSRFPIPELALTGLFGLAVASIGRRR